MPEWQVAWPARQFAECDMITVMTPLLGMLGLMVAIAATIAGIVAGTYGIWLLWEWLSPSRAVGRGFDVIIVADDQDTFGI